MVTAMSSKEQASSWWYPLAVMRNITNVIRNNPNRLVLEPGQEEKKLQTNKPFRPHCD